jgi:hypothetical protein
MVGASYSRGGIDINNGYVGPVLSRVRSLHGPNGASVTEGQATAGGGQRMQVAASGGEAGAAGVGSPLVVLTGLLGLAVLLWLARKNSQYLQQNVIGLNTFNVLTIGIISVVGILLLKITFNKLPVPGITPVVNAI